MSIDQLQKNIYATLAYYDGMDYPMTAFEVWKYLIAWNHKLGIMNHKYSLTNIINGLDDYELRKLIEEHKGFYFLRGRKKIVEERLRRNKIAESKLKKLRRVVWFIRFIPFVRMIGVAGRLAMKHTEKSSDWDVLVVLKSGKIWTGRTLATAYLQLIGKRRQGDKIKDRVCLNHFITDGHLKVETREKFPEFSAHEFSFMFPIFDAGIFQKFQLRNSWIKDYHPNYYLNETGNLKTFSDSRVIRAIKRAGEIILSWEFLENWLADWQARKIMNNPKTSQPGSFIKFSERALVFLPKPQGSELLNNLSEKMRNFPL